MAVDPRTGGFLMITGVTFAGFASGFGSCLFDVEQVDACVAVSRHWEGVFQQTGNHILEWGFALMHAVFSQR